jgi:hypothetical protein
MITLFKAEPFKVELAYAADDRIPAAYSRSLGSYSVDLPKVRKGDEGVLLLAASCCCLLGCCPIRLACCSSFSNCCVLCM